MEWDWQTAYEPSDRGFEVAPWDQPLYGNRAVLECEMGEIAQSEAHLEQLLETWCPGGTLPSSYVGSSPAASSYLGILFSLVLLQAQQKRSSQQT